MMNATLSSRFMSEQTMLRSIMSPTSKTEELVSSHNIKVGNTSYAHCYELVMWALQLFISLFLHDQSLLLSADMQGWHGWSEPVVLCMQGKPSPKAPKKRRFFQLSHDGSTLRWSWNKYVIMYYVEVCCLLHYYTCLCKPLVTFLDV